MQKTPSEMKELVTNWAEYWSYSVKDIIEKQSNKSALEWILEINNGSRGLIAYTEKETSDVLRFQCRIDFSPEHRQKTAMLSIKEHNNFVLETTDRLVNLGCDWLFEHDKGNSRQMNSLSLYYFLVYDAVDKNAFLHQLNQCFIHINHMVRAISIPLSKLIEAESGSKSNNFEKVYV